MHFVSGFFLLVIFMSSSELFLLIKVAAEVGFMTTFMLCLLTGVLGGSIVRLQGLQTIRNIQFSISRGQLPANDIVSGLILIIIGALLIVPGFITDVAGFVLLVPGIRQTAAAALVEFFKKRTFSSNNSSSDSYSNFTSSSYTNNQNQQENKKDIIIDITPENDIDNR